MNALILAALLSQPVSPLCEQWIDRMEQESRYAARLVWSPRKERHIERANQAAEMTQRHCESAQAEQLAVRLPRQEPAVEASH